MTAADTPASLMYEIVQARDALDRMCVRLNGHKLFGDISLETPRLRPAELGLLRAVSWFYVLYREAGLVSVKFLSDHFEVYALDGDGSLGNHVSFVDDLRTCFQHNLDPGKERNRSIQDRCERWFKAQCGTVEPLEDEQWSKCLNAFLSEVLLFFTALKKCIRAIEQDEALQQILKDWKLRHSRYHAPHEFDNLISVVAIDMGRSNLDIVKFRKRHYEKWIKSLELIQGGYDFDGEARRLIEYALLSDTAIVLPITGKDILAAFPDVEPGPRVGELLAQAKSLYEAAPSSREELLAQLQLRNDG